jgi:hypothetical protein
MCQASRKACFQEVEKMDAGVRMATIFLFVSNGKTAAIRLFGAGDRRSGAGK